MRACSRMAGIVGLSIVAVSSAASQVVYRCPLAPVQGAVCQYVDKQRLEALINEAVAEAGRWAVLQTSIPAIQKVVDQTRAGADRLTSFDTTLRRIKTPRASVPTVFAAAWNLAHPTASIRVVATGGRVVVLNAAALSDSAVRAMQGASDPMREFAAGVGQLSRGMPLAGASGTMGTQLAHLYDQSIQAADTNTQLVENANRLAARSRSRASGMQGESEAHILAAKGTFDLMRGLTESQRLDGAEATVAGLRAAQQARAQKTRAIQDLARFSGMRP